MILTLIAIGALVLGIIIFVIGMDVAKISDTEGKGMCKNPEYITYLQRCIDWRMKNE